MSKLIYYGSVLNVLYWADPLICTCTYTHRKQINERSASIVFDLDFVYVQIWTCTVNCQLLVKYNHHEFCDRFFSCESSQTRVVHRKTAGWKNEVNGTHRENLKKKTTGAWRAGKLFISVCQRLTMFISNFVCLQTGDTLIHGLGKWVV